MMTKKLIEPCANCALGIEISEGIYVCKNTRVESYCFELDTYRRERDMRYRKGEPIKTFDDFQSAEYVFVLDFVRKPRRFLRLVGKATVVELIDSGRLFEAVEVCNE